MDQKPLFFKLSDAGDETLWIKNHYSLVSISSTHCFWTVTLAMCFILTVSRYVVTLDYDG